MESIATCNILVDDLEVVKSSRPIQDAHELHRLVLIKTAWIWAGMHIICTVMTIITFSSLTAITYSDVTH